MSETSHKVVVDPELGYRRLDPLPTSDELDRFYESRYFDLIRKGGRAPEIRKVMEGGEAAEREREWLRHTLFSDVCETLRALGTCSRVLDIGCGNGDFVRYAVDNGLQAHGIEPSEDACQAAQALGLNVQQATLAEYVAMHRAETLPGFDAVVLLNVLEHVPRPKETLEHVRAVLRSGGLVCIRVPNDFSEIQLAAQQALDVPPWWVAVPDHVNYFSFESLCGFLERCGFEVLHAQGDFPMELFLLMGRNYIGDPEEGGRCQRQRVRLEFAMPPTLRRRLYQALAQVGIGRNCLMFARRGNE